MSISIVAPTNTVFDKITRVARKYQIGVPEATTLVKSVLEQKVADQAKKYIGEVEYNDEPVAVLMHDLLALAPPPPPTLAAKK